jgi:two-component system sensor histidine kinase BaeS
VLVVAASIDGSHELVAVQSLSEISAAQTSLWAIAAVSLAVAALVMYAAGGVLARRLTAPLVRLERAAESVAAGQFGTQVEAQGDLETVSLARSFNRMSTRVADAYSAQKAFVADVSHEIRTPLTSIRGFAEALLDGTVVGEGPQRHAATVIRDESIRIAEVSDTLLAMAELDAGTVQFARTFVDNRLLADALRGRFAGVADQKGQRLGIELSADDRALADQERLLQALTALVSNAVAYTPSGGTVMVTVGRRGGRVVFAVDDSGPGVPAERRAEVFGRFTRLESSRSARTGGAGLGLAICRRIIESMDGTVAVCDSELGGARFEIDLPAT